MEGNQEVIDRAALNNKPHNEYVVGFLFDESSEYVLMVQKNRPEWQKDLLNGLGGRIEPGEYPADAMSRECIEEAGVNPEWSKYATVTYGEHVLHFFASRDAAAFSDARSCTDEHLVRVPLMAVLYAEAIIPNLRWLIPMARHHLFYEAVAFADVRMTGAGGAVSRRV